MAQKRRHHYLPKFYLDGFIDQRNAPYVWVFEKGNSEVIKVATRDLAVRKNYYAFTNEQGQKNSEAFENALADIESRAAKVVRKIENAERLDDQERSIFALFLAVTMLRVPSTRENIERVTAEIVRRTNLVLASNPVAFKSKIEQYEKDVGHSIGMPIEELRRWVLEGNYEIKVSPEASLSTIQIAERLSPILAAMRWTFWPATPEFKFVTSDNPLFYIDLTHDPRSWYGVGLLNKNVEVTFPISQQLGFVATWLKPAGYRKASNEAVKTINRRTILSALRFVFGPQRSDALNRLVQKCSDTSPKLEVH